MNRLEKSVPLLARNIPCSRGWITVGDRWWVIGVGVFSILNAVAVPKELLQSALTASYATIAFGVCLYLYQKSSSRLWIWSILIGRSLSQSLHLSTLVSPGKSAVSKLSPINAESGSTALTRNICSLVSRFFMSRAMKCAIRTESPTPTCRRLAA